MVVGAFATKGVRVSLAAIWAALTLLVLHVYVDLRRSHEDATERSARLATSYVRLVAEHASATFDRVDFVLERAVRLPTAADQAAPQRLSGERQAALEAALKALQAKAQGVVSMSMTDQNGYVYSNTVGAPPGGSLGDRAYFLALKDGLAPEPVVSEVIKGRISNKWGIQVARRITAPDGGFGGMVVANVGMTDYMEKFYEGLSLGAGSIVSLRDARDRLLVRHPASESTYGKVVPFADAARLIAGGATEGTFRRTSPIDDVARMVAIKTLPRYDIYALVGIPESDVFGAWTRSRDQSIAILALALAAAIFATVLSFGKARLNLALSNQLSFQDALLDTLPIPVFARNANGVFVTCNKSYEMFFGTPKDQLIGKTAFDVFEPELAQFYLAADAEVLASRQSKTYETTVVRADGAVRRAVTDKACYLDGDGRVAGIVATTVDVTEQVRAAADLRAILDNMIDIFYRTDAEGRFLMLSRSAETVLGYTVDEMLGTNSADYHFEPECRMAILAAMEAGGGSIGDFEFRLRDKAGQPHWVSISARFYFDDAGGQCGTEGIVRLIEERKRAEIAVRDSQSLIQAMLDASSDAIMLLEPDGRLLAVNRVMAGRFGTAAEKLAGACLWDLFPPAVAEARKLAAAEVLRTGQAIHTLDRRGEVYLDNSIYPVMGSDGRSERLAVYSRDITEQTLAEARIAEYVAEVERSNAELEQFAYVASHDLREPLRMISSYMSLLERRYGERLDDNGREFLGFARDGATRMDRLVLDLLDFSRIERRGAPMVDMPLLPAIQQAIRHLDLAIGEAAARVLIDDYDTDAMVMGDIDQITRLFQNLIGNALKYRAEGRPAEIHIGLHRVGAEWEFQVADNGIGIEEQYFERIFRIFQRLHTRDKYDGTGIGLAICKKIVERHGGRLWVESVLDQGSTFRFTLPAAAG